MVAVYWRVYSSNILLFSTTRVTGESNILAAKEAMLSLKRKGYRVMRVTVRTKVTEAHGAAQAVTSAPVDTSTD